MSRRNPVVRDAFRSGAGAHQRSRAGQRQQLARELEDTLDEYLSDLFEDDAFQSGASLLDDEEE